MQLGLKGDLKQVLVKKRREEIQKAAQYKHMVQLARMVSPLNFWAAAIKFFYQLQQNHFKNKTQHKQEKKMQAKIEQEEMIKAERVKAIQKAWHQQVT